MSQKALDQRKGIPDLVFLLDATGSMTTCLGAIAQNISSFIDSLANPDANGGVLVRDWRIRVVGYRDKDWDGPSWLVDNLFSADAGQVKGHLLALEPKGGHDEPESLLDALYEITQWPTSDKGAAPSPNAWRHRHDASRVVVVFTDASCKLSFKQSDGTAGGVTDLINLCQAARLKVILFAPDAPSYGELTIMSGLEWEIVGTLDSKPQQALADYSANQSNFKKVMDQLAKTVAISSVVETVS